MGLFSGKDFSLKNIVTMPFDIVKNDLSALNEFRKNPKKAFGKHQRGMTDILGGVGFNKDSKLVKNSDAIMGAVLGGIVAGPALMGGGAAAGGGATGAATGGAATGATTGAATGSAASAAPAAAPAAQSGAWLNNPYAQAGMGLLQGQLNKPQQQTQPMQIQRSNLMANAQQQQGTGYQYRGLLS